MRITVIIIAILFAAGCTVSLQIGEGIPDGYGPELSAEIETVQDIQTWISHNVEYEYDQVQHGEPDYWQTPAETVALGSGDCEDKAILMQWMIYEYLGSDDSFLVILKLPKNETYHAAVLYEGDCWEPRGGRLDLDYVFTEEIYTYWETIEYAQQHHGPEWRGI